MADEIKKAGLFESDFKLKFGIKFCVLAIAGVLSFTLTLHLILGKTLEGTYANAIYTMYDLKIRIFPLIFASFYSIFILGLITVALIVIALLYSHKIAGPIFRIGKNLEAIGWGDLTVNTKFRGNDQLMSLADDINKMVRSLNHTVRGGAEALEEIGRAQQRLASVIDMENPSEEEIRKELDALKVAIARLKGLTEGVRIKD